MRKCGYQAIESNFFMGKNPRLPLKRLAGKLLQIRRGLGLSQQRLLNGLGFAVIIHYKRISDYELGKESRPLEYCWLTQGQQESLWKQSLMMKKTFQIS